MSPIEARLDAPSQKFKQLNPVFEDWSGVRPAYAAVVSKAGNFSVRFEQSKGAKNAALKIAVIPPGVEVDAIVRIGETWVQRDLRARALVFCAKVAGKWDVVAVHDRAGGAIAAQLTREDLFPNARVTEPGRAKELLTAEECAQLADELHLDRSWLEDVVWMLNDKRAIVFYGPPGTGKTWLARELAARIQPEPVRRRFVQLHPSYGYEEFFEGYRPTESPHGVTLVKRDGPLRTLARAAGDAPTPVVLCLDEMNRGNLPKVFGELYFLLEYRDEATRLMYSPEEEFRLPRNLYIIGCMNTADRSIVSVDQALRRRFHFVGLFPSQEPVRGMLRRYLALNRPEMAWVADLLDRANALLADKNMAIGPSHFMRDDLDEAVLRHVWNHAVLPTIEDHFFGNEERLEDFKLDQLRAALASTPRVEP